jgi:hypothetical protein
MGEPEADGAQCQYRRWRVADRLGEQVIDELLEGRRRGLAIKALAERYGISLSSMKRLPRVSRPSSQQPRSPQGLLCR